MKIFCGIVIIFAVWACQPKNEGFTIQAQVKGLPDSTEIYFQKHKDNGLQSVDSTFAVNGQFQFTGKLQHPEMIYFRIDHTRKIINIFGENSDIKVVANIDSLDQTKVTGSKTHQELMSFKQFMQSFDDRINLLMVKYQTARANNDTTKMATFDREYESLYHQQIEAVKQFITNHKSSYLSPYLIRNYLAYDLDYQQMDSILNVLDPELSNTEDYQQLANRVATLKKVAVGQPAINFTLNDTTGNPIALNSFRGKYLLVDFWASWCRPCREENPNVVKIYQDYHNKGFEILGVSFDTERSRWIDAIRHDHLSWYHVSDLQGWQSAAGKLYGVNSIPHSVLLDPNGIIIANDLRGDDLRYKLKEIFDSKEDNS